MSVNNSVNYTAPGDYANQHSAGHNVKNASPTQLKILFIVPTFSNGGQEKAGMILCNYLMQYHNVLAVCFKAPSSNDYDYKCAVERIVVPVKMGLVGKLAGLIKKLYRTRQLKKHFQPDVSIAFGDNAIIINQFTRGNEIKVASLRHSFKNALIAKTPADKITDKLYRFCLQRADKIVPVSSQINQELKQELNIDNDLFVTNGYDIDDIREKAMLPVDQRFQPFFESGRLLVHSGRFNASKCHFQLVRFFVLVKQQLPDVKLLLLGGIDTARVENKAIFNFCIDYLKQNNCIVARVSDHLTATEMAAADVLLVGHQMNPFKFIAKAKLFVFPSALEGFPNALVEAMACGVPVVSADCPTGPKEILAPAGSGLYGTLLPVFDHNFDPHDNTITPVHTLWADTIVSLLSNESSLKQSGEHAAARARQFSFESVCKKWLHVLTDH